MIVEKIGIPAMYEQLAEECAELEIPDDAVILSDDELFRKLQEIPGIGERTAAKIVAYIMTEGNV